MRFNNYRGQQRADAELVNIVLNGGKKYNKLGMKDTLSDINHGKPKHQKKRNKSRKLKKKKNGNKGKEIDTATKESLSSSSTTAAISSTSTNIAKETITSPDTHSAQASSFIEKTTASNVQKQNK